MTELHLPWLELAVLVPLLGAALVNQISHAERSRTWCVGIALVTFLLSLGGFLDFLTIGSKIVEDRWHLTQSLFGRDFFELDAFAAPLLPLTSLIFLLTAFATLNTKIRRFSFVGMLISESIVLAMFCCKEPWGIIVLLVLETLAPFFELRARNKSYRVFVFYMGWFILLLIVGWANLEREAPGSNKSLWAMIPLLIAVLIRCGIAPFHGWMTDLFEKGSFGTALLYVIPLTGVYGVVRLVFPYVDPWLFQCFGTLSLITTVYAGGMAMVQRDARRFFCYFLLSQTAMVLVGLESETPLGITGALCLWLSVGLSLSGFGLTLRALEARRGTITLAHFQGLYEHAPALAVCFLLTGLATVGFPCTVGFVAMELLVDGVVKEYPYTGIAVIVAAALNGIAIVRVYFRIFSGTSYSSSLSLSIGFRERLAVQLITAMILIGGVYPQPAVQSRYNAATGILDERSKAVRDSETNLPATRNGE